MWDGLPLCDFKTCKHYSCGNCMDEIKHQTCEYPAIKDELDFTVALIAKMIISQGLSCEQTGALFDEVICDAKRLYGKKKREYAKLVADALYQKVNAEVKTVQRLNKA